MQSEAHIYLKSPKNIEYQSLFLHSAQSFNQLSNAAAKVTFDTKKDTVDERGKEWEGGAYGG